MENILQNLVLSPSYLNLFGKLGGNDKPLLYFRLPMSSVEFGEKKKICSRHGDNYGVVYESILFVGSVFISFALCFFVCLMVMHL